MQRPSFFDDKKNNLYSYKKMSTSNIMSNSLTNKQNINKNTNNQTKNSSDNDRKTNQQQHCKKMRSIKKQDIQNAQISVINIRKQNAKRNRELTRQKQKQIQQLRNEFNQQKQQIIAKYQNLLKERDQHIKLLQESLKLSNSNFKQQKTPYHTLNTHNQAIDDKVIQQFKLQTSEPCFMNKSLRNPTMYMHQQHIFNDIDFSIQSFNQTNKLCYKNKTSNLLELKDKMKQSRKSLDLGQRATSGSKHQLNPVPRPTYKLH